MDKPIITSIQDYYNAPVNILIFSPDELPGMMVLREHDDAMVCAKVVRNIMDWDEMSHQKIKFLLSLGDGQLEEIISYNKLSDLVTESMAAKESGQSECFSYSRIADHQGSLKAHDLKYCGSSYNVLVTWDDSTQMWEPLNMMAKQDLVTLARYAHDHDLINKPGWKFLRRTAKHMNAIKRRGMANQVQYKFGVHIPHMYNEAIMLDKENGNTLWQDAIWRELDQILSYKSFCNIRVGVSPGGDFKKIKVKFILDCKADGCRKGCLVAWGGMTPEPEESVFSSVATLCSLCLVVFLAELNGLNLMQGDIGNAYLESCTQEKVYFIVGPEFGQDAGCTFIIDKALYGLHSSGLHFHERLSKVLRTFEFRWSKVDPDLWMRDIGDVWEYIVIYVDDIIAAMKDAQGFFDALQGPNVGFIMKGIGKPSYHLGADFFHDADGTLCLGSQTYSKQLCSSFESLYGEQPKTFFPLWIMRTIPNLMIPYCVAQVMLLSFSR